MNEGAAMTRTTTLGRDGATYLAEVDAALSGVAPTERAELLEEVEDHLAAIHAELAPEELTRQLLLARLGPPSRYAADLAGSAGVEARATMNVVDEPTLWDLLASRRGISETWQYIRRLEPGWWALRGYLIAGLLVQTFASIPGAGNVGHLLFMHWRSSMFDNFGFTTSWVRLWLIVPIMAVVVISVLVGTKAERQRTVGNRLLTRAFDGVGVFALIATPMWWIGPEFYAFAIQR